MSKSTTKIDKLYSMLTDEENHTVKSIQRKTGLRSVSSAVRSLREEGFTVYLNTVGRGAKKQFAYRMAS